VKTITTLIACLFVASMAYAASLEGIPFEEKVKVGDEELVLNGLGPRFATLAKVRVYVAGLYLPEKTDDAEAIIGLGGKRQLLLVFKRDVSAEQSRDAWKKGFGKSKKKYPVSQDKLKLLLEAMSDVAEGEQMIYSFDGDKVEILVRGESKVIIEDSGLVKALFAVWLKYPPNKEFGKGLLGS
jgi:hypothetical protein